MPVSRVLVRSLSATGAVALIAAGILSAPVTAKAATTSPRSVSFAVSDVTNGFTMWTVPASVTSITVTAIGANGGRSLNDGDGGFGAIVTGTATVTPGDVLTVAVGISPATNTGGGVPGGGTDSNNSVPGGGGGFSGVRLADTTPLVIAGAGGGAGLGTSPGGDAGQAAPDATDSGNFAGGGGAGTQTAGGAGGASGVAPGNPGSLYQGGSTQGGGGGGGGGGFYGGGGGGTFAFADAGGGGGSSFPDTGSPNLVSFALKSAPDAADGSVTIAYDVVVDVVTFDPNGGTPTPAAQNVDFGTVATSPTAPTWSGHALTGWFTAAVGGTAWDFATPVTSDLTLHAHWVAVLAATGVDPAPTSGLAAGLLASGLMLAALAFWRRRRMLDGRTLSR